MSETGARQRAAVEEAGDALALLDLYEATFEERWFNAAREIARDLALALCGVWLVLRPASTLSLDRALFGPTKEHA